MLPLVSIKNKISILWCITQCRIMPLDFHSVGFEFLGLVVRKSLEMQHSLGIIGHEMVHTVV